MAMVIATALGVGMVLTPTRALAEAADSAQVTPPRLVSAPAVALPEGEAPVEPVTVLLELSIDEEGHVTAATVAESGGAPYDAEAVRSAGQFVFEPARRAGTPLAVTVSYRYVFRAAPAPAAPAPPPVAAVAAPAVVATAEAKTPAPTPKGESAANAEDEASFEATAEIEAPPRETTKRTIEKEELTRVPGTRGDALRAIEVLPGVARTSVGDGTPILRGAGSDESQVFLDGIPVPFLYHFGGVTSFYSSRLLSQVDLYPGNFSTRFGRAVGGVVNVKTRDPAHDRFHGMLDLSLIDTAVLAEVPLSADSGLAIAGRRSNIDLVYSKLVPDDAFSVVTAPVYYDYQAIYAVKLGNHHRLRLLGYGSRDALELLFSDPNNEDPGLTGGIKGTLAFHRFQAELRSDLAPGLSQDIVLAFGSTRCRAALRRAVPEVRRRGASRARRVEPGARSAAPPHGGGRLL